jgi:hypothetical protein
MKMYKSNLSVSLIGGRDTCICEIDYVNNTLSEWLCSTKKYDRGAREKR